MKLPSVLLQVHVLDQMIEKVEIYLSDHFQLDVLGVDLPAIHLWLTSYKENKPLPTLPLNLSKIKSPFGQKVLAYLPNIQRGKTISYGAIAEAIDKKGASRAVGNALSQNPFPFFLPCHRVIHADGTLGGFTPDIEIKRRLLKIERAQIGI